MPIPALLFAALLPLVPAAVAAPACQRAPKSPTGLTVPELTATSITLRWDPVPASPGCQVTYQVTDNDSPVEAGLTAPALTLKGLEPGSVHFILVQARNQAGASGYSVGLAVRTRSKDEAPTPAQVLGHGEGED